MYYYSLHIRFPAILLIVLYKNLQFVIVPYPHERGPTTECWPTPHFGLNFLLRSSVYLNMCPCVAVLENAAQMAGL